MRITRSVRPRRRRRARRPCRAHRARVPGQRRGQGLQRQGLIAVARGSPRSIPRWIISRARSTREVQNVRRASASCRSSRAREATRARAVPSGVARKVAKPPRSPGPVRSRPACSPRRNRPRTIATWAISAPASARSCPGSTPCADPRGQACRRSVCEQRGQVRTSVLGAHTHQPKASARGTRTTLRMVHVRQSRHPAMPEHLVSATAILPSGRISGRTGGRKIDGGARAARARAPPGPRRQRRCACTFQTGRKRRPWSSAASASGSKVMPTFAKPPWFTCRRSESRVNALV